MSQLSQDDRETYVIDLFLPAYSEHSGTSWRVRRKRESPDFEITDGRSVLGVEVTAFSRHPSTESHEQKEKWKQFNQLLRAKLKKHRLLRHCRLVYHAPRFVKRRDEVQELAERVAGDLSSGVSRSTGRQIVRAGGIRFEVYYNPQTPCPSLPVWVPSGSDEIKRYFTGLRTAIFKKVCKAAGYDLQGKLALILYPSDLCNILIDDDEICAFASKLGRKRKSLSVFREVWLVRQRSPGERLLLLFSTRDS